MWPQRIKATLLTLKLLVNKSGLKLRLALAGKYQLTALGLWEITVVGTRIGDFYHYPILTKDASSANSGTRASFIVFTVIRWKKRTS